MPRLSSLKKLVLTLLRSEHPVVVSLGVLASVATIVGLGLVLIDRVDRPDPTPTTAAGPPVGQAATAPPVDRPTTAPSSGLARDPPRERSAVSAGERPANAVRASDRARSPVIARFQSIRVTLGACRRQGISVICSITVVGDKPGNLSIHDGSRAVDAAGVNHHIKFIQLADLGGSTGADAVLTPGIEVRGTIRFDDIPAAHGRLQLLELAGTLPHGFRVQFRNVPIDR
jgi:hypothetical protein